MKKGFTLIELLAVIVILAIIALIAVPIVLNIIEESKENSDLRSAEMYLDAVELSIASRMLENKSIIGGTYNILENGNICLENYNSETKECEDSNNDNQIDILEVEVKGQTPEEGSKVVIEESEIKKESSTNPIDKTELIINNKEIVYNSKNKLKYYEFDDKYVISAYEGSDNYFIVTCPTCEEQEVDCSSLKYGLLNDLSYGDYFSLHRVSALDFTEAAETYEPDLWDVNKEYVIIKNAYNEELNKNIHYNPNEKNCIIASYAGPIYDYNEEEKMWMEVHGQQLGYLPWSGLGVLKSK